MSDQPVLIGIDWGTSSFRAYLIADDGTILERRAEPAGLLQVRGDDFEGTFNGILESWLTRFAAVPIIACGMVGSRQGWKEAPYADCPATAEDVAGGMIVIETRIGRPVHIVPGLTYLDSLGVPDVMRGKESQIIGAMHPESAAAQLFILPGTHCKWAAIQDGRVERFATFMTGELFEILKRHSLLGRMMAGDIEDAAAFRRGVAQAAEKGGLSKHLFSARSLPLLDRLPRSGIASYMSGLLIGAEVHSGMEWLGERSAFEFDIAVLGSQVLRDHYVNAFNINGVQAKSGDPDAVALGLLRIARLRRLL